MKEKKDEKKKKKKQRDRRVKRLAFSHVSGICVYKKISPSKLSFNELKSSDGGHRGQLFGAIKEN